MASKKAFILLYADKLLHFSVCDAVLYWGSRGVDASQCHYHFHVRGVDAECGEPVAGGFFEDAIPCTGGDEATGGDRCADLRVFYHGGGGGGGECGVGG